ncbi:MAG: hypothetical protein SFU98_18010 [Leptospiraceae bacterium]|nr:hypothetical protein [Leptospiraceae bacterium]
MKLVLMIFLLVIQCKENPNILSEKYAERYLNDDKTKKLTENQVTQYIKNGDLLNKAKKYAEAIQEYETGLKIFPTPELYFSYGNTLSNLKKNHEAKQAFLLALHLKYEPIEILYYNLACLASLQENKDESLKYLLLAMENGYFNLDHIQKDSDLVWLRSQVPNFTELVQNKKSKLIKNYSPAGMVYEQAPGGGRIEYFFCGEAGSKEGLLVIIDNASYPMKFSQGSWKLNGVRISSELTLENGKTGYGKIISEGPRHNEYEFYKDYTKDINTKREYSVKHFEMMKELSWYKKFTGPCPEYNPSP